MATSPPILTIVDTVSELSCALTDNSLGCGSRPDDDGTGLHAVRSAVASARLPVHYRRLCVGVDFTVFKVFKEYYLGLCEPSCSRGLVDMDKKEIR